VCKKENKIKDSDKREMSEKVIKVILERNGSCGRFNS
jgi:hypothetical protein